MELWESLQLLLFCNIEAVETFIERPREARPLIAAEWTRLLRKTVSGSLSPR